jgi:hypothetical protein
MELEEMVWPCKKNRKNKDSKKNLIMNLRWPSTKWFSQELYEISKKRGKSWTTSVV